MVDQDSQVDLAKLGQWVHLDHLEDQVKEEPLVWMPNVEKKGLLDPLEAEECQDYKGPK